MDSTCRCIHIDQNSSVCVMLMLYKCLRRGKPQLWLMLCIVCKRQNIQRVMAIAMLVWELAETIMLYNDNNSMLGNDQHIQNHLLKYRTLDSSLCEETSGWLCSIPMLLPLTGEETPRDLLSVHWGLLYQRWSSLQLYPGSASVFISYKHVRMNRVLWQQFGREKLGVKLALI